MGVFILEMDRGQMERLIGKGRTADVFLYGENKVIKVFHKEFTKLAYEEYATVQSIESIGLSVPCAYGLIDVDSRKAIVYEYVKGISMLQLMRKNPFKVVRYAKLLATLHAQIHSKPISALADIKESISATIRNLKSINEADREAIIDYLNTLPDGDRLCHYDFHPGNVLMFEGNAKVIDWMTAGVGNPCADICRTSVILKSNILPPDTSTAESILISIFRKIFHRNYINHYLEITGITSEEVEKWILPVAAARLAEGVESEVPYLNDIIMRKMFEYRLN